jgi:Flp pilus assembly protein TadB
VADANTELYERMASVETKMENIEKKLDSIENKLNDLTSIQEKWNGVSWAIARVCAVSVAALSLITGVISAIVWFINHSITLTVR